jgi:acyl carrier protein
VAHAAQSVPNDNLERGKGMTTDHNQADTELIALVADALRTDPAMITLESGVGDVPGWDSFAQVNLLMKIEDRYQIAFEADDLLSMETLGDILDAVLRLSARAGAKDAIPTR